MCPEKRTKAKNDKAFGSNEEDPIPPRGLRQVARKRKAATGSSRPPSPPLTAAQRARGWSIRLEREAREEARLSGAINKMTAQLMPNFLYRFRNVERSHLVRPTDYTKKEYYSPISRDEDPFVYESEVEHARF